MRRGRKGEERELDQTEAVSPKQTTSFQSFEHMVDP